MKRIKSEIGMTLVEVVMVIIIMGILTAVAVRSLSGSIESSRVEETRLELDQLANAIVGNAELRSNGLRTDFGYVGDIGALPASLDDLVSSPGYATWRGPYIQSDFSNYGDDYKRDAWGALYQFGGTTIQSVGGTETLTRIVAPSSSALVSNSVTGTITDGVGNPPGDSAAMVSVTISFPNGSGGTKDSTVAPSRSGRFSFNNCLPIGNHSLRAVYSSSDDTVEAVASVLPNSSVPVNLRFPGALWAATVSVGGGGGSGSVELAPGTVQVYGNQNQHVRFSVSNFGSALVMISSITATYSKTAYFRYVDWDGSNVFNSRNPRAGSGEIANFNNSKILASGATLQVRLRDFRLTPTGGSRVDMHGTDFTIEFSDGSSITFTTP